MLLTWGSALLVWAVSRMGRTREKVGGWVEKVEKVGGCAYRAEGSLVKPELEICEDSHYVRTTKGILRAG